MTAEGMFGESAFADAPAADAASAVIDMHGAIGSGTVIGPAYFTDVNGTIIGSPGIYVEPLRVQLEQPSAGPAPWDSIDDLPLSFARSFRDEQNETGTGTLATPNDVMEPYVTAMDDYTISFFVYGQRAFTMLVESVHRVNAAPGEEYDQVTVVIGRGHLAAVEEAVMYPSRGPGVLPIEEDRTFNWSSPSTVYDDSGWGYAYQIVTYAEAQVVWPSVTLYGVPFVSGWPDPDTGVIWAPGSTIEDALEGFCYFRRDIDIPADDWYLVFAACDNEGELWLDGQRVLNIGGFLSNYQYSVYITAGTHTIAVKGENYVNQFSQNPAGLMVAIYSTNPGNEPVDLIVRSDSSWKIVAYPPGPPGMLVGSILYLIFDEAQARGVSFAVGDIELMFTETVDSGGQPWPETVDIATKVGTSYLTFLMELCVTYIDVWMEPGSWRLYAWNKGGQGVLSSLSLDYPWDPTDPTTGNLYELAHTILS